FKTVVPFRDLLGMEGDSITIKSFFRKMSRTTDPEWRALLALVRKNKASPSPVAAVQPVQASPSPAITDASASTKRDR
ncbi:hypothetical protein A2U01_0068324, partial [Trifolium medium]|nr:hypothetical protein [Trifolium medium]